MRVWREYSIKRDPVFAEDVLLVHPVNGTTLHFPASNVISWRVTDARPVSEAMADINFSGGK
jgi:hypothetical protein